MPWLPTHQLPRPQDCGSSTSSVTLWVKSGSTGYSGKPTISPFLWGKCILNSKQLTHKLLESMVNWELPVYANTKKKNLCSFAVTSINQQIFCDQLLGNDLGWFFFGLIQHVWFRKLAILEGSTTSDSWLKEWKQKCLQNPIFKETVWPQF